MRVRRLLLATLGILVLAATSARAAGEDIDSLRDAWSRAETPKERANLVPRIVALRNASAASMLSHVSRTDPDAGTRAAAARGLGTIDVPEALDLLVEGVIEGGPRGVREMLARGLSKRSGGVDRVLRALDDPKTSEADAALLLLSLASFRDPLTLAALTLRVRSASREIRETAVRALAMRRDAREARVATISRALADARDTETRLAVLDAAELVADPTMRPILSALALASDPAVRESAAYVLERIRLQEAAAAADAARNAAMADGAPDRYAPPASDDDLPSSPQPPPLPTRGRYDLVYVIDVTGSASSTIDDLRKRIEREIALFARVGASSRIGVVAYRGGHGAHARRAMDVLAPCYDVQLVTSFLEHLVASGVDEQGAAVAAALSLALDRTAWRWDARRDLCLLADSPCDQPLEARSTVGIHFAGDGTRSTMTFVLRTRNKVPPEYDELAKVGGTGVASWIR